MTGLDSKLTQNIRKNKPKQTQTMKKWLILALNSRISTDCNIYLSPENFWQLSRMGVNCLIILKQNEKSHHVLSYYELCTTYSKYFLALKLHMFLRKFYRNEKSSKVGPGNSRAKFLMTKQIT